MKFVQRDRSVHLKNGISLRLLEPSELTRKPKISDECKSKSSPTPLCGGRKTSLLQIRLRFAQYVDTVHGQRHLSNGPLVHRVTSYSHCCRQRAGDVPLENLLPETSEEPVNVGRLLAYALA